MRISIEQAAFLLNTGQVIGVPTETVYGLAASLHRPDAIEKIFLLKKRPQNNPLIIHVAHVDQIIPFTDSIPPSFYTLAEAFWPGPLTLIMPILLDQVPSCARAGLKTAGFRIPNHPLTRDLIERVGPLTMPSANLSGRPSSTSAKHVEEDFGTEFPILDGGCCARGLESTILHRQEDRWVIVRLGSITSEAFFPVLGYIPKIIEKSSTPICPGQLYRHYAPKAKLILGKGIPADDVDCIIGFKGRTYPKEKHLIPLGSLVDPCEVATNLYQVLRQLDEEGIAMAWVDTDFPLEGLWITIAERLNRPLNSY